MNADKSRLRPRILVLGPVPPPYMGPTIATTVILQSRLKEEFELIHLDTSDHREISTLGAIDFWNIYLPIKFYLLLIWMIIRTWPEVVYVPISQTTIGYLKDSAFLLIAKLFRRKVLCHLRGGNFRNWLESAGKLTNWYTRTVHSHMDGQIVLGERLKPLFRGILPEERLFVVPNGKNIQPPGAREKGRIVRLLYLANMVRTKGVLDVLYAVPLVVQECPDVEFVFCGAWEDTEVQREVENFLDAHRDLPIRWLGPVHGAAKNDVIAAADIFLFPTYYPPEGHPWVIVEAMGAGLPIIATDQGAIVESVINSENGFIIDKRNPQMLAEKAVLLIRNESLRKAMGRRSRELYESRFTEARMVANMAIAFRAVLAAR
jgi:glycosyltransferase involved in cell wall biosynthesis